MAAGQYSGQAQDAAIGRDPESLHQTPFDAFDHEIIESGVPDHELFAQTPENRTRSACGTWSCGYQKVNLSANR
jgi:hypothetical protein